MFCKSCIKYLDSPLNPFATIVNKTPFSKRFRWHFSKKSIKLPEQDLIFQLYYVIRPNYKYFEWNFWGTIPCHLTVNLETCVPFSFKKIIAHNSTWRSYKWTVTLHSPICSLSHPLLLGWFQSSGEVFILKNFRPGEL